MVSQVDRWKDFRSEFHAQFSTPAFSMHASSMVSLSNPDSLTMNHGTVWTVRVDTIWPHRNWTKMWYKVMSKCATESNQSTIIYHNLPTFHELSSALQNFEASAKWPMAIKSAHQCVPALEVGHRKVILIWWGVLQAMARGQKVFHHVPPRKSDTSDTLRLTSTAGFIIYGWAHRLLP